MGESERITGILLTFERKLRIILIAVSICAIDYTRRRNAGETGEIMKMVKAEGLTYEYTKIMETDHGTEEHRVVALKNVNIEIEKGEFVVVLGHNGSGKSTFAKHINALLQPTGGTLWVKGMNTQEEGLIWEIRQTAGMVFQNPDNQLVATVVEEDIAFGPENMGVPPKEIRMRVDEAPRVPVGRNRELPVQACWR